MWLPSGPSRRSRTLNLNYDFPLASILTLCIPRFSIRLFQPWNPPVSPPSDNTVSGFGIGLIPHG
ncbi:hypothetical protein EMPG_11610 [Blastomyces silverae]|uniref:Uncharacterized protein n=1 Tax=Blastomyces silverae TaxID=2060906 RepID=A0A0H1BPK6_9EURO|nr:hypothetical protein EMPG_11610 [Blastomyces silverae]